MSIIFIILLFIQLNLQWQNNHMSGDKQTNDLHSELSIIIYQACFFLVSDILTWVVISPANWASKWAINWIYWPLSLLAALTHRCSWPFQSKAEHLQTGHVCDLSPARAEVRAAFKSHLLHLTEHISSQSCIMNTTSISAGQSTIHSLSSIGKKTHCSWDKEWKAALCFS